MTAGLFARGPAIAALVVVALLATATLTLAATSTSPPVASAPAAAKKPTALVVPDVRHQAYVFAKGTLEQDGFAWRVEGGVPGYAANVVVSQTPQPGALVVPNGAPIVVLRLTRNGGHAQEGTPENVAPYPGKPARLVGAAKPKPTMKPKPKPAPAVKPKPAPAVQSKPSKAAEAPAARKPAFTAIGAPAEPLDEIALPARAKQLAAWVEAHPKPTTRAVNHWLYQHNWIVTGARFGWSQGAEALRILIAVDARTQELWGLGNKSERLARRALAHVSSRSG